MTLSQIINELDKINARPMDQATANATKSINEAWSAYANIELGEVRQQVEDRMDQAWSKMRMAGF